MAKKVLDFVQRRKESIEKKRRNFERIMFENVMGVYTAVDQGGAIYSVELIDISHEGCLFQVPWDFKNEKKFEKDTEINFRMYFTKKSFIPVVVKIKYGHEYVDETGRTNMRYGAEFDSSLPSFKAVKTFIEFLYQFAEYSAIDRGDPRAFFL
ncbi:MAG: PilZ domain-containing protein [Bacteriovoracaceae bacterium]|nr:PilZ domain-containing protein [Bacteriovoracaceae bacterium]